MRLNITKGEFLDGFFLRISKDSQVIFDPEEVKKTDLKLEDTSILPLDGRPSYFELRPELGEKFAVYCHEYWHYLISISTLSRLRDLHYLLNVVALFSKTLTNPAKAISAGRAALEQAEIDQFRELQRLHRVHAGNVKLTIPGSIIRLLEKPSITEDSFKLRWGETWHRYITLRLLTRTVLGEIPQPYNFGMIALEEGLTAAITLELYPDPKLPSAPYGIARLIAEDFGHKDLSNYEIAGIITLALLTMNPPLAYLDLLESYKNYRNSNDSELGILTMWEQYRNEFEKYIPDFEKTLDEMVELYQGRGIAELGTKYIRDLALLGLRKRLTFPLFELIPFKNGVDLEALNLLLDEFPPCNTVQEREGNDDQIGRDILSNRDVRSFPWNRTPYAPGEFLISLACNFDFAKVHAENDFEPSENITHRCPFYECCTNPRRQNDPKTCKSAPWNHFDPLDSEHCWYGEGAMALRWRGTLPIRE